jgi:pimeloyl-ACP methyl ester carboxylesterase
MTGDIIRFQLNVRETVLDDLRRRLDETRWPDKETVEDWSQGAPLAAVRVLADHWRRRYDWRRCEAMLNGFGQFHTAIDGLRIHFLHIRSPEADAMPMLLTHGWPGSVVEFFRAIEPLTDPAAHGGDRRDAFHLVIPSLPGYGFSEKPATTGWTVERIAAAWSLLMNRLGYSAYVAQGGDWGSAVTSAMARAGSEGLLGIHLNMVLAGPDRSQTEFDPREQAALKVAEQHRRTGTGYSKLQSTKPQTIGYALADSPVAQAAWIYEKFQSWTDCDGSPESVLSPDAMLDNIMLYWLPNAGASAARLYWESFGSITTAKPIEMPVACTIFPRELVRPTRAWAQRLYPNIVYWAEAERGGHFAAFEQPEIFVREVRAAFRSLRSNCPPKG